jgi:hypothetical protein
MTFVSHTRVNLRVTEGTGDENREDTKIIERSTCRPGIRILKEAIDPIQDEYR